MKHGPRYTILNPLAYHLLSAYEDTSKRFIILYGGSSSGKSYSVAQTLLMQTLKDGCNTLVMRKVGASIAMTIYEDFKVCCKQLGLTNRFKFKEGVKQIISLVNGAHIDFKGLDDDEKIKGISNYKRVFMDEWSEFELKDFKQMRKRLRGMKGQQIITAFNPIKETHWIKRDVFDVEKWDECTTDVTLWGKKLNPKFTGVKSKRINQTKYITNPRTGKIEEHAPDTVVIQTTYLNNFWVVGSPDGTFGYYDEQCIADFEKDRIHDPDYYNVYALGEWGVIRTGSEFFGSFNRGVHVGECSYNPELPLHICVDSNVLPYISVSYWQVEMRDGCHIRQIGETCAESPNNTVRKSAKLVASRLREMNVDRVYLHGDASTKAANNIDDEKRSFHDLFIDTLQKEGIEVEDKVGNKNPSVAMSGEFINAIFDNIIPGLKISIGEDCQKSIEDYLSVQKDVNGAILKTKVKNKITMQTFEEHGHLSDTFRYLVVDVLREQFLLFSNRRKRNLYAKDGAIHFFNPGTDCKYSREVMYAMPNINGKFAFVHGALCGDKWHILNVGVRDTSSTEDIADVLVETDAPLTVLECPPAYYRFVNEIRKRIKNVRVMNEVADLGRRIAATSDFVKNHLLFSESKMNEDADYSQFITHLLDYNKSSNENIEASAVLSGFIQFVIKFKLETNSQ